MKKYLRIFAAVVALLVTTVLVAEESAHARAGGGRSFGSRGSRSYSQPVAPPSQSSPSRQYAPSPTPSPAQPYQQPSRGFGGFGRSMLGGLAGGLLGGMLFRSLGFGGGFGGGGGIGLFEILLLAGIAYMIYRMVVKKRQAEAGTYAQPGKVVDINQYQAQAQSYQPEQDDLAQGIAHIRQMDPNFEEARFNDAVMDTFFKIQGAWMNRDLSVVSGLLTDEMRTAMQGDVDQLLRDKRVNRLENIAVRTVEISEAWQESGKDYVTALIYANLLDYTTDDTTGAVVSGSKTDPVKFEEYWTFTRAVGNNPWKLSAINQK
ncbi:MAG TPA: Tim44 domain-containing protein [Geobacter sp.]|nr:Tim44 domain-containing protein [Geobacter sp.]